jgi:transposase
MIDYREIIRLKSLNHSNSNVAVSVGSSRNTVAEVWRRADEHEIEWPIPDNLTNRDLQRILYPERKIPENRKLPDFEYIHNELVKPGVTLSLLWAEYCADCEAEKVIPYQSTQFNEKYHAFAASKKATLRIHHKPGEKLEVDWAGKTLYVTNNITGELMKAYLFVATLPCSLYSYAEVFPDVKSNHWIEAHIHAYSYFGGVTRILIPDNLKTGVIKNTHADLILNRSYHEMAEFYGTAIIPARPKSPKDKPSVEGTVGIVSTWIIAALRDRKFFSYTELNEAIRDKLKEFNEKPFQKKTGSRLLAFEKEEKPFLMPLPTSQYETAVWSDATIQTDYLITVGNCKYSVPYEYIGKEVEVRTTEKCIEVFYQNLRIASHVRVDYSPDPVYIPEHMPENHRKYLNYNSETFIQWASDVGSSTKVVIKNFLYSHKVEQQGYKSCTALMKLADRYSTNRLEAACEKALSYTPSPSIKNITTILKNGQDKVKSKPKKPKSSAQYGITRNSTYCRGGDQ